MCRLESVGFPVLSTPESIHSFWHRYQILDRTLTLLLAEGGQEETLRLASLGLIWYAPAYQDP
eukprot:COSAG02_NODE_29250_length_573_cov_0.867089_1_plen_62_part_10